MNAYKETLERFQNYVLDQDTSMENHVVGNDLEFKQTRLNVYHHGYALRLLEILGKCYPALKLWLGEALFEKLGREYIAAYPSHHFSIALMGRYFSQFLSTHPLVGPMHTEMATFEWLLEQVIDAADGPQLTFDEMATTLGPEDWANLSLKSHPSLMTHAFYYPIPALWQHLIHEEEKPDLARCEAPVQWLIWRFDMRAHFCSATEDQFALLTLIQKGRTFSEICAELATAMSEEEVVNFVAGTLRQWISEGIFSEYSVSAVE